ncbi:adenylate/guanylate cyclase domain-containing protein [Roseicella aquatilis]|nr:adenylate/guanylate cyclase domain-containing protein [Roseicella aquatilis]
MVGRCAGIQSLVTWVVRTVPNPAERGEEGEHLLAARQAAVAFADIVGYSILMATEERRTHERWMALLRTVIQPLTAVHCGRVVDLRGDGVLAEFATAADGLRWALDLQRAMRDRNQAPGETPAIALRIGLHLGEVLAEERNIFGDAVNIAARLQEQAQPGGIALSQPVLDGAAEVAAGAARDLGLLELKNISRPIRIHAIDTYAQRVALPLPRPPAHALPSIAVLPLHNLGGEKGDDYFAEGVVEDIVVSLAGLRELFVIARASTLAFRGAQPDPRQLGRALGVRYLLTGSLRRQGRQLRIAIQLCETQTGGMLWGDRITAETEDLFEVQDRITRRVVAGIAPNVRSAELARALRQRPESFTAYDHMLKALAGINSLCREIFEEARDHLAQAMAEDPDFAMPIAWAARWHSLRVGQGWSPDPAEDARTAAALAQRAIELDPQNALALATYGHLRSYLLHDCASGRPYLDRALEACPNSATAWVLSGANLAYLGRGAEAVRHAEQGIQLSPFDQGRAYHYSFLAIAHYANGSYEESLTWARRSVGENPFYTSVRRSVIVALAGLGRIEEARQEAARLLELEPDFRLGPYERVRLPYEQAALRRRCMEHLRAAGLPD